MAVLLVLYFLFQSVLLIGSVYSVFLVGDFTDLILALDLLM